MTAGGRGAATGGGPLRACGVQLDPELGAGSRNAARAAEEVARAAAEGARLVVFPEAALTGYVFESREEAEGAAVRAGGPELAEVARACRDAGAWAVVGAIERADDDLFNTAFVLGPEGPFGRFRKVHTLCLGVDRFTRPGEGFRVFELPFGRVGVHICYDGSFPESARVLRLLGAQLVLLPTNWPDLTVKRELVRVRAYENHVNYFAVNRVGEERGTVFPGGSMATDPLGRTIAEGGDGPQRVVAEFDLEAADENHVVLSPGAYEFDYRADRRPDAYGPILDQMPTATPTGSRGAGSTGSAESSTS